MKIYLKVKTRQNNKYHQYVTLTLIPIPYSNQWILKKEPNISAELQRYTAFKQTGRRAHVKQEFDCQNSCSLHALDEFLICWVVAMKTFQATA